MSEWDDLRRRLDLYWFAWLGGPALGGLVLIVLTSITDSSLPFKVLVVLWIASFFVASLHLWSCRCPRYGRRFFWGFGSFFEGKGGWWPFRSTCRHCGARKWSKRDPNPD